MAFVRAIVLVLGLSLGGGSAWPMLAALFVGEVHVCHCHASHQDCLCVKCHPDNDDMRVSEESVRGQCGDDDVIAFGKAIRATVHEAMVSVPRSPFVAVVAAVDPSALASRPAREPAVPPPKMG